MFSLQVELCSSAALVIHTPGPLAWRFLSFYLHHKPARQEVLEEETEAQRGKGHSVRVPGWLTPLMLFADPLLQHSVSFLMGQYH